MAMPELALTGQPQYWRPLALSGLTGTPMNSLAAQLRAATVDMRAAYLATALDPSPAAYPILTALPASGELIFRSGSDLLASYLHLAGRGGLAQANAGGHSQGDASSFLLYAHGQLNFYLADSPGAFAQLFLERGMVLYTDTLPLVRATRRATVSWQKASATRYDGSVSQATTLTLVLAAAPLAVTGAGVASYTYDAGRRQLRVVFAQPTAFVVELAAARPTALPVVLTVFTARRVGANRVSLA